MPDISKITLPSGTTYDIKDAVAREAIAGGVSFIVAWDGASTPVAANIPAGVVVTYNGQTYTGTLSAETTGEGTHAQAGAFYLVRTSTAAGVKDSYDEYVSVGVEGSKTWEKLGDTQIDLSNVVTDVSLTKQTANVIGANSTFTVTQPNVTILSDRNSNPEMLNYEDVVLMEITGAHINSGESASAITGLGTPSTSSVLTGVKVTAQPSVTLTANTATATGRIQYVQSQGTATTTKISATAAGGSVSASGDSVTAITGLGTPTTQSAVKSVTPTTKKLATSSVTGVQSSTTTASKATAGTAQTVVTGDSIPIADNTYWLKGISVENEVLSFDAAEMSTVSIPQYTFSDVTVPIKATSATTVATGATTTSGSGADIVTDVSVGDTFNAVTGYASPTTDTVLGTASTFAVTDPTITIASGSTGDITVATGIGAATTRYLSASASGTTVGANGTVNAVTGYPNVTTDDFAIADATIGLDGTYVGLGAEAASGAVAWNSKDQKTVLTNTTDVSVTKGQ